MHVCEMASVRLDVRWHARVGALGKCYVTDLLERVDLKSFEAEDVEDADKLLRRVVNRRGVSNGGAAAA